MASSRKRGPEIDAAINSKALKKGRTVTSFSEALLEEARSYMFVDTLWKTSKWARSLIKIITRTAGQTKCCCCVAGNVMP